MVDDEFNLEPGDDKPDSEDEESFGSDSDQETSELDSGIDDKELLAIDDMYL
jgi:hypothetical protein